MKRHYQAEEFLLAGFRAMERGEPELACEHYKRVIELVPEAETGWVNLGVAQQEIERRAGGAFAGREAYTEALKRRRMPEVMNDLANILFYMDKDYAGAEPLYREAAIAHKSDRAAFHLALCLLMMANETGDPRTFREGWQWAEWRRQRDKLQMPDLEYRGEGVEGKRIAVLLEQGIGDQLFSLRFLKALHERGAKVIASGAKEMRALCLAQPYIAQFYDEDRPAQFEAEHIVMAMSLPMYLLPDGAPRQEDGYIFTGRTRPERGRRKRVGLCWKGSTDKGYPGWRNIDPSLLAPLVTARPDIEWVSLQYGEKADLPIDYAPIAACKDWRDSARLVETLDLVITVDTSIPHLAAGVGVPVWLLDRWSSSWQWTPQGSRWYASVRTFRQPAFKQWQPVVDEVAQALSVL